MTSSADLFRVFGRIGLLSFGGPAAQIALMHKELVEDRDWLSDKQFLGALSFCMLLPGPEAMQLATYSGWKLRGVYGGLMAGGLFVLPGAAIILALAMLYVQFGALPLVQTAFVGVKAAVVAIVFQSLWKVSEKALNGLWAWGIAVASFVAIYGFNLSFVLIIALAAGLGVLMRADERNTPILSRPESCGTTASLRQLAIWSTLWAAPVFLVAVFDQGFLIDVAFFFSKLAVVTFGGAYAVLAYMTQMVTLEFGWLSTPEMIDALGLAETTPGPLILVTEFVALIAGYKEGGLPLMLLAGALALWCTFLPCFLWIFVAAPYVEQILANPKLKAALEAITAAVVGVILNLSVWFTLHVVFSELMPGPSGLRPVLSSFDANAVILVMLASVLLLALRSSVPVVLIICAAASLILSLI